MINATAQDDESVVADECHIISSRANGPRYDPSVPSEKLDSYDNLMLLCRTHHKMVDDQAATFTTEILHQMKANHQAWVAQKLAEEQETQPVRFRRVKQNIPDFLLRLTTGKEILDIVSNAMAYEFDHDELSSQEEVGLVGGFLQLAQDWGDLCDDLEAGGRVQTTYELSQSLQAVEEAGFFVFGGQDETYRRRRFSRAVGLAGRNYARASKRQSVNHTGESRRDERSRCPTAVCSQTRNHAGESSA